MTDSDLSPTTQQKALCNGWAIWFLPLTTSVLLYASYFPLAIGWFAWFALIPWLVLVKLRGGWRLYCSAYLSGLAFYLPVLQWARVADPRMYVTWIILAFYCSLYFPLVLALTRRINRTSGLPLIITFPVVWVTGEYLRWGMAGSFISLITNSHQHDVPGGFSWYMLGYSQQDWLPIIQIAPGNVRELANVLERAQILAEDHCITVDDLPDNLVGFHDVPLDESVPSANLHQTQRRHVINILREHHGNKVHAARALGISRRALYRLLDKYGIRSTSE